MSQYSFGIDKAFVAGADLSALQYRAVALNATAGQVVAAKSGGHAVGIVQNGPTQNRGATVRLLGPSKVVAGAAIGVGDKLSAAANGKVRKAAAISAPFNATFVNLLGVALESASGADEVIEAFIFPNFLSD